LRSLSAQVNHCDPNLRSSGNGPYGYRLRGDRCEGEYSRPVDSTTLLIASLTESVEDFVPATDHELTVEWMTPGNAEIHLRSQALRRRLYYRMDTIRPAGSTSYAWTPNLLAAFNLKRNELGTVAWVSYPVGNTKREVYLPVRIRQQASAVRSRSYQLTLLPGVEFAEVFYSLAPVGTDGRPGAFIKKDQPLEYGYYPAERQINIQMPELKSPGIYYVSIGATRKAGGSTTAEMWFYHSGR
jgi:hypothetical protein